MDKQAEVINITDRIVVPAIHKTSSQTKSKRNKKNLLDDYQEKLERQAVKELNMEINAEAKKAEREAKKAEREAKKAEREAKKAEREAKKAEREAKKIETEKEKYRLSNIVVRRDQEIDLSSTYKLTHGVYHGSKVIGYFIKQDNKSSIVVVDVDTIKVLCNNGYIINAHNVEATNSIAAHGGDKITRLKLVDFDRLNVIHMTNKDIKDKSTGSCRLAEIVLGKYNKVCKLIYMFKDKQYIINITDVAKYRDIKVQNTNTGGIVNLIIDSFRIPVDKGDKFKDREHLVLGKLVDIPMYTLKIRYNTDADMLKELLGDKVKITSSNMRQIDVEYDSDVEQLLENMGESEVTLSEDTKLTFLFKVKVISKAGMLKYKYCIVKDYSGNTYLLSYDNIINTKLYKNGDFSQLKDVNVAVDWINVVNKYNRNSHEYNIIRTIDRNKKSIAFMTI